MTIRKQIVTNIIHVPIIATFKDYGYPTPVKSTTGKKNSLIELHNILVLSNDLDKGFDNLSQQHYKYLFLGGNRNLLNRIHYTLINKSIE